MRPTSSCWPARRTDVRRALLLAALLAVLAPAGAVADHRETVLASPGSGAAFFGGGSPDGKHVYFVTTEQLADEDTDSGADLYDRHDGTTELVSAPEDGAPGGSGGGTFAAASKTSTCARAATRRSSAGAAASSTSWGSTSGAGRRPTPTTCGSGPPRRWRRTTPTSPSTSTSTTRRPTSCAWSRSSRRARTARATPTAAGTAPTASRRSSRPATG